LGDIRLCRHQGRAKLHDKKEQRSEVVATPANTSQTWRFGVFEVDTRREELRRSGTPVKMREQSFRILVYLLEHAGEIVTREELRRVLWPSDTFVDFDHSLNTAVMKLRDALGDSTDAPLYIETIPKRGYRFIAPVSPSAEVQRNGLANAENGQASPPVNEARKAQEVISVPAEIPVSHNQAGRRAAVIGSILGLILLVAVGSVMFLRTRANPTQDGRQVSSVFQIVPVTSAPGDAIFPVFSPDGREIAYIWDGPERRLYDVYAQLVGADRPLRLTYSKSGLVGAPAWSPDGSEIAFSRCDGNSDGVYVVPALGGAERKLTSVGCLYTLPGPLAWLADGKGMLMIDHCSAEGPFDVVQFSLATGEKKCLTNSGSNGSDSGYGFALSPDGQTIAFSRTGVSLCCNIYTIPLSGGPSRLLTADSRSGCSTENDLGCDGLMWTPDSKSIVFVSNRTTLPSLWQVLASGGTIERQTTYPAIGNFSKDGRRFVYSEKTSAEPPAIWRADLAAAGGPVLGKRKLISTQYPEMDAQPSPDGSRIVWMSIRTGSEEIWTSSVTGENTVQLTRLDRYSGTPRWSPDGRWIAFDSFTPNGSQIYVVDSEGRNLRSITTGPHDNAVPSWSQDGKSIYFASRRTGSWQVWKHSLESGAETQLTEHGGFDAFESYDGHTIYFSRFDHAGIWSIPASGGAESPVVVDKPQLGYWGHWAVSTFGLYLLDTEAEPTPAIEFYRFATRRISPVLTLEKRPARQQPSLSATADGRTVYYTQYDRQSVIKLMDSH
jgi:Tol biopolymer transport system component/DNA-binding winged helix-turn-helix (wHTH) protein